MNVEQRAQPEVSMKEAEREVQGRRRKKVVFVSAYYCGAKRNNNEIARRKPFVYGVDFIIFD
jgi:hypothetical protein